MPPWTNTRSLILTTDRQLAQPPAVVAVAPERQAHLDQPERHLLKDLRRAPRSLAGFATLRYSSRSDSESARDEGGVFAGRDQPQVAEHARGLVVAEQQVQRGRPPSAASVSSRRTRSSALRESSPRSTRSPSWTTCVSPPIQRRLAVDDAGDLQDLDEAIVGAVHVADGDDALDRRSIRTAPAASRTCADASNASAGNPARDERTIAPELRRPSSDRLASDSLRPSYGQGTGVSGGRPGSTAITLLDGEIGHRGARFGRAAAEMRHEQHVLERSRSGCTAGSFS